MTTMADSPSETVFAAGPHLQGVQLYTLRNQMQESLELALGKAAAEGYRQVEFAGFYGHSAAEIKTMLERHGLTAPASHFSLEEMEADFAAVIEQAKTLGSRYIVLAWLEPNRRNVTDYRNLVEKLNRWGRLSHNAGLRLAYHNHDFEFEPIVEVSMAPSGDLIPYRLLLEGTDPQLVFFEMDLYWMHKAAQQPECYFARYPGRFPLWHLKDADEQGAMADVGQGVIDFPALLGHARQAGLQYAFVERDDAAAPYDSIRRSLRAVKSWDLKAAHGQSRIRASAPMERHGPTQPCGH